MIVPFFPPMGGGGVHRPLAFVRHLPLYGWRATVVAPRGDAFWIRDESLLDRIPAECHVIRTDTWSGQSLLARSGARSQSRSARRFGAARRAASLLLVPDTYLGWRPFAVRAALDAVAGERFDAVYSTSPPETGHLVAETVHGRTRLPWVADFRDPWMNLHLLPPPTPLHAYLHRRLEARVCRNAHVVVTTRWHERMLRDAYPSADIARVPNGFDGEAIAAVAAARPAGDRLRIVHGGMLTQKRSAVAFLSGLHRFLEGNPSARDAIRVEFVGPREDDNDLAVARLNLGACVTFRDTIPHAQMLRTEKEAHVLLLIKHANPRYDGLVPGKLYEYVGLCRPILALVPAGEAKDLVESLARGETALPDDVDAIAQVIARMYQAWRAGALDTRYDLTPRPEFDRARLAGQLAAVLERAAAGVTA